MLILIATVLMFLNMVLELVAIGSSSHYLIRQYKAGKIGKNPLWDSWVIGHIMIRLVIAHLLQMALWAGAFIWCSQFSDWESAFYHSTVNFASLGYGDIVMSKEWRLLGSLEAATGVMMFGISAAMLFAVLSKIILLRSGSMAGHGEEP